MFHLLGSVGWTDDEGRRTIRGTRQRTLLALLLLEPGHEVSKEEFYEELWGEYVPTCANNALQALMVRLRRSLQQSFGADFVRKSVVTGPGGYRMNIDPLTVDAHRFENLVRGAGETASSDPLAAERSLTEALALWRGSVLQGVAGSARCASAAAQLDEARLIAAEERIRLIIANRGYPAVISELKMLARRYPWREGLTETLMVALYRSGRQAEAVQAYNEVRSRLVQEFGMEPSPNLRHCMYKILNHERLNGTTSSVGHLARTG